MTIRDEGATHYFGDDCPGGHRASNVAGVDWDDQETADEANAREAAERSGSPVASAPDVVTAEIVRAYNDAHLAYFASPPQEDNDPDSGVRAGLAAVVPLIRAQTLREYADRWHYVDHSRWPMSTFGAAPTPFCACGKTWPEGGCTERRNLIADADTFHEPDEPVADVVAAFEAGEAGEKGVTKRPVSATAIRGALYDSLSPNFEIDSEGYDDAAVAVAKLVDGVEP